MPAEAELQDQRLRIAVYDFTIDHGVPPTIESLTKTMDSSEPAIRESLERLAAAKALVLQRRSREILMAEPFSAVPTPFVVHVGERLYYGNCIWDALGIPAMLHADARIDASCGCCAEAMSLQVSEGTLAPVNGVVHFAIPARQWWRDIVFT